MKKSFDLETYKQSDERWAICSQCDWDFQPIKDNNECPTCHETGNHKWVDEEYPNWKEEDWIDYLKTDEELEAEEAEAAKEGILGAAWFTNSGGMEEFMEILSNDIEKILNDSERPHNSPIYFNPVHFEPRAVHGFVITSKRGISEYRIGEYFQRELETNDRDMDEEELENMTDKEYQQYLEDKED